MRYFKLFADAAFSDGPNGERLFYLYGPWSRPYIIPDAETEHRLYRNILWYYRVLISFTILIIILIQQMTPRIFSSDYFILFMVFMTLAMLGSLKIIFMSQVRNLNRSPSRSLRTFYDNIAQKTSYWMLSLQILICVVFIVGDIALIILHRTPPLSAIIGILFFGGILVARIFMWRKRSKT